MGTTGFGLFFLLPIVFLGYPFLTHSQIRAKFFIPYLLFFVRGNARVLRLLLRAGADPEQETSWGRSVSLLGEFQVVFVVYFFKYITRFFTFFIDIIYLFTLFLSSIQILLAILN